MDSLLVQWVVPLSLVSKFDDELASRFHTSVKVLQKAPDGEEFVIYNLQPANRLSAEMLDRFLALCLDTHWECLREVA